MRILFGLLLAVTMVTAAEVENNLIGNGGFETGDGNKAAGWGDLWTRGEKAGELARVKDGHGGQWAVQITHRGENDWSLNYSRTLDVQPGDIYELSGWLKVEGEGSAMLCVTTKAAQDKVVDWSFGSAETRATTGWKQVHSRFVIPPEVVSMQPRLIGDKPATICADDIKLESKGNIRALRTAVLQESYELSNGAMKLVFHPDSGALEAVGKRTWQQADGSADIYITNVQPSAGQLKMEALHVPTMTKGTISIELDRDKPEYLVTLDFAGPLGQLLNYPGPLVSKAGDRLIVPLNEGIGYPVDDNSIKPMALVCYGGHGICMSFFGLLQTDNGSGMLAMVESPDDAIFRMDRGDSGLLQGSIQWEDQKGQFGYARKIRYCLLEQGGYVAMCKRYRQYAQEKGLVKTLRQKQQENPHVDLLVGAANIWNWDSNAAELAAELQAAGIERILWSNQSDGKTIEKLNGMKNVLSSRYDIYQDVMDPAVVKDKLNNRVHGDWTQAGWPQDIMLDASGGWIKGWGVDAKDGQRYNCGVLCDSRAVEYARQRVTEELKTHPYRCRFIDTTTASPWRECWSEAHPMTRTDSRVWKMKLLEYLSNEARLVTGSETGHDAAAPFVHYFEGMLSLGPYRVAESGRNMIKLVDEVPDQIATFQVGTKYRLPLWELVYHDCVVAQWYWGDYNNKLPKVWRQRDLFNLLYGTPPMYMFTRDYWKQNKQQFVDSYQFICPTVRKVGYSEMTSHAFLTPDGQVQQSRFADGTTVTANFSQTEYKLPGGQTVAASSALVQ